MHDDVHQAVTVKETQMEAQQVSGIARPRL